jgi:hypothetical protein
MKVTVSLWPWDKSADLAMEISTLALYAKKARMSKSEVRTLLICLFDCRGIMHREFVPTGHPVNQNSLSLTFCESETVGSSCKARNFLRQADPTSWHRPRTQLSPSGSFWRKNRSCPWHTPCSLARSRAVWLLSLLCYEESSQGITL